MWRAALKDGAIIGFLMLILMGIFFIIKGISHLQHSELLAAIFLIFGCISIAVAFYVVRWRKIVYGDGPTTDEREQLIRMRGDNAGALAFIIFVSLACLIPVYVANAQDKQMISVDRNWLAAGLCLGFGVFSIVRTFVIRRIRKRELTNGQE